MAFRFRRSVRLAPGIRVNFGKRGMSLSAGVRGASVTFGPRGVYGSVGIPGTGLSYRSRLDRPGRARRAASAVPTSDESLPTSIPVQLRLQDDGSVDILGPDEAPLEPRLVRRLREAHGDTIRDWLEEHARKINAQIDAILNSHHGLPHPDRGVLPGLTPFDQEKPRPLTLKPIHWYDRLLPWRRKAVETENIRRQRTYDDMLAQWHKAVELYEAAERLAADLTARANAGDVEAMTEALKASLGRIEWPRETHVEFDFGQDARSVEIDVDLPEIEDVPNQEATVAQRGLKLSLKDRSEAQRRRDYSTHIHAVGLRIVGEAFAALPYIREVTISAYSQRLDKATGARRDEYLYSARIARAGWAEIDFEATDKIDPVVAFERFELRRQLDARGNFKPIEPIGEAS